MNKNDLKEKIMEFMEKKKSTLFDDLERAIPELKDEMEELVHPLSLYPYENIKIWAMSKIGAKALSELINEKKLQLKPMNRIVAELSYSVTGTNNEIMILPTAKQIHRFYKDPHWIPCKLQLKNYSS